MSGGHIRKRGTGSWELKFDPGRDPITGKRITKFKTIRGTKSNVEKELRRLLTTVDTSLYVQSSATTLMMTTVLPQNTTLSSPMKPGLEV